MLNTVWQQKYRWLGHIFKNGVLLRKHIEGKMKGKVYESEKGAEDREGWTVINRRGMS